MPIGIVLLFLMAVAPVLPWRKASTELLSTRLFWPAWCGVGAIVFAVLVGADGWAPLVAFGLAGFASGAALRQLVLATRRQGWRGLVGRANGGMVVHLGVIMIAVALAASNSFTHSATLELEQGEVVEWGGHTFELQSVTVDINDAESERALKANVLLDGEQGLQAGHHDVPQPGRHRRNAVGAYRVRKGRVSHARAGCRAGWDGGGDPGLRQADDPLAVDRRCASWRSAPLLAAFPGSRRRKATDPVSAPIATPDLVDAPAGPDAPLTAGRRR